MAQSRFEVKVRYEVVENNGLYPVSTVQTFSNPQDAEILAARLNSAFLAGEDSGKKLVEKSS